MALSSNLGHFNLLEEIAHGGMGTVLRAFDPTLNREVAIKVLRDELASDPKFLEDFLREARVVASISHPHIVQIYFVGEEAGQYYLVMELLKGRTLQKVVDTDGPLAEESALDIAIDVAEALRAAYKSQMIHGDIKPANIFITEDFGAKVLDFGLAKLANIEADATGGIWGSPYYMSPERVGQKAEDFRSDIYSLGATLFDALTGRPPFDADSLANLALKRLNEKPPLLREVNPSITTKTEDVVNKMLNKSILMRYRDYDHLLEDLREAKTEATAKRLGVQLHVQPGPPEPEAVPPPKQPPLALILTAAIALLVVAGGVGAWLWSHSAPKAASPPTPTNASVVVHPGPTPDEIARSNKLVEAIAQSNALARAQLEENERQLILTTDRNADPSWYSYDFAAVLNAYKALEPQITTSTNRVLLRQRLRLVNLLVDFKSQLISDIPRLPYDGGDLQTRQGSRLVGRLARATDTRLVWVAPYGELAMSWADLPPPMLGRLATFYATAFASSEIGAVQGHRYLMLVAFCQQYGLAEQAAAAARKAVQISPELAPDVAAISGSTHVEAPAPPAATPVSQRRPVTASSYESGNGPSNGNDGNFSTRWTASSSDYPQWWRVDLGNRYVLTGVKIYWYDSASRYYQYKVEVSTDNVAYATVMDKTGNTTVGNTTDMITSTGRYVRVTVTGARRGWAAFYECQVSASGVVTPPVAPITVGNFGFETPETQTYTYNPSGASWTFSGSTNNGSGVAANNSSFTAGNAEAPQGVQVGFIQVNGTVSQTVTGFVAGTAYKVTFAASQRQNKRGGQLGETFNVTIDGKVIGSFSPPQSGSSYRDYSATFTATATSHTLAFVGTNLEGGDNTVFLDNIRITPASANQSQPTNGAALPP